MKNRSEIGYLTILGLSLTVVLTVYKESKPLKQEFTGNQESVKSHLLQTGGVYTSSSFDNSVFLSQKGSYFLFSNSHLFANIAGDAENSGLNLYENTILQSWLETEGIIRIHIAAFHGNKSFSTFPKQIGGESFLIDGLGINNETAFDHTAIRHQESKRFNATAWLKQELLQHSSPSRAGPFSIESLV
jgi:hypothetical protein